MADTCGTMRPLSEVLQETPESAIAREQSALTRLLEAHANQCVIYGAGTLGKKALSLLREMGVNPLALTDGNDARWDTVIDGLPILSPAEAADRYGKSAVFFVTVWNDFHWFRDTEEKLSKYGCVSISSYAPIFWHFGTRFMDLRLLNDLPHRLFRERDAVLAAEGLWADEESLITYRSNICWRAFGDPSQLPFPAPQNTYFPADIFHLQPGEVVIDCGAFDGDTIRFLVDLVGDRFTAIHAIEADQVSCERLETYVSSLPHNVREKVHRHDCAVGKDRCVLRFSMSGNATSSADDAGVEVQCFSIDELFPSAPVTLIKMDIEGAEYDALLGARHVIERDLPILAICVYHTQNDIWRIPLLVRSMNPSYSFFLRTYDGDGFQTVMYAIPPHRLLSESERAAAPKPLKRAS